MSWVCSICGTEYIGSVQVMSLLWETLFRIETESLNERVQP